MYEACTVVATGTGKKQSCAERCHNQSFWVFFAAAYKQEAPHWNDV